MRRKSEEDGKGWMCWKRTKLIWSAVSYASNFKRGINVKAWGSLFLHRLKGSFQDSIYFTAQTAASKRAPSIPGTSSLIAVVMGIYRAFTVSAFMILDIYFLSASHIAISEGTLAMISQESRSRLTQSSSEVFRKMNAQALYLQ